MVNRKTKRVRPTDKSRNRPSSRPPVRRGGSLFPAELSGNELKAVQQLLHGLINPDDQAYKLARETIARVIGTQHSDLKRGDAVLFLLSCSLSVRALSGYATLDRTHIDNIRGLTVKIQQYAKDISQKRPLNFLMLAAPGAGKSHFIKCVAEKLRPDKVSAITFNMTSLASNEDLIPALDAARNLKVEDRIPLLFLDEFDSMPGNIPLLLPLLWDGELTLGQRDLKLGRVIVVLAGSDPALPITMDHAKAMRHDVALDHAAANQATNPKIIDLLSRINGGVVDIPPFYDPAKFIDRRADKVCVAIQLLRQRFGPGLKTAPLTLLRFIVDTEFRYGVRSIAHLIELIPNKGSVVHLRAEDLELQLHDPATLKQSSLAYHLLHEDQVHGVVQCWKAAKSDVHLPVFANVERYMFWPGFEKERYLVEQFIRRISEDMEAR